MNVKQILVWRKDLKVRTGKFGAQMGHAASYPLGEIIMKSVQDNKPVILTDEELSWFATGTKKICLQVEGEKELMELYSKVKRAGLTTHLVVDSGLTEFAGVPTKTCLSIGPHEESRINVFTSELKLY